MTDETLDVMTQRLESGVGNPRELAELLIEKRRAFTQESLKAAVFGDLTDVELDSLLRTAYEVSFKQDEGRYPRFTICVPSRAESHMMLDATVIFDPPVAVHTRTLRRLSVAVPQRPHALLVRATADDLMCVGIGRFETGGALLPEDQTGMYLRAGGLLVEIGGPGDLTVHEAGEVYTLRAGRIERQFDGNEALSYMPHFSEWLRDELLATTLGESDDRQKEKVEKAIRDAWMYVLKETVELSHGGAFGVLPIDARTPDELPQVWRDKINIMYSTTSPDLLQALGMYVSSRWGGAGTARTTSLQSITDAAGAASRLSATDGFVMLNRGLKVLGFGAKIGWDDPVPDSCVEVDDRLESTGTVLDLTRVGTRHTAAYRLCQAVPDSFVFVVSQDGELRIFFTPAGGEVRVTAPLAPVTYLFQGM